MLNNVMSLCMASITQVWKYLYTHSYVCMYIFLNYMHVYIYTHTHICVVQKHINVSYTGILFASSKLSRLIRI